ncbi:hypothetical protein Forpi1262_v017865 [Fusarium oxysporum f. sp. raphani]|uniref:Uncharacterized protein n=1 Tax=Fusarium oxysporum f. sp. raphani TaxID=96318 RepID=A0A8J5NQB1_FUSOX|nr:hypothetical protein Forpi1262_v018961 [Fusarium oxysporum f. sp. raphani]KAG7410081.1 hypothetical protein Forpi1262_v017865 [Fusarium oxysporum f. sp. raphani]
MRFNTFTLLFALAVWVGDAIANSKIKVEVRYSDRMVDVGNLDLFKNTWQEIYGATGNQQSVVSDKIFKTFTKGCTTWAGKPAMNAQVKINGQWGRIPGGGPHDSAKLLSSLYGRSLSMSATQLAGMSSPTVTEQPGKRAFRNGRVRTPVEAGTQLFGNNAHAPSAVLSASIIPGVIRFPRSSRRTCTAMEFCFLICFESSSHLKALLLRGLQQG